MSRLGVAYFANDGSHQFNVILKDMREVGMNKLIGGSVAVFHVKVLENRKKKNYNSPPAPSSWPRQT